MMNVINTACFAVLTQYSLANAAATSTNTNRQLTISNKMNESQYFNFGFTSKTLQGTQTIAKYAINQYPCIQSANDLTCTFQLPAGKSQVFDIEISDSQQASVGVTAGKGQWPRGPCNNSLAEMTFTTGTDTADISYVNGQSAPNPLGDHIGIIISDSQKTLIDGTNSDLKTILNTVGIYPPGCSRCAGDNQQGPTWTGCPATPYGGHMPANMCKAGTEFNPTVPCNVESLHSADYTFTFSDIVFLIENKIDNF
eukprot:Pgem_evm2s798